MLQVDLRCHHNTRLKDCDRVKKGATHQTKNTDDCPAIMTVAGVMTESRTVGRLSLMKTMTPMCFRKMMNF